MKNSLIERDKQHIWHPYTQHKTSPEPLAIKKGEGVYLVDEKGNKYIDAISSWWTNLHGHSHPYIAQKIYEQALELEHVIFAGCTHEPAVLLAERVLQILPGNFSKIFYSDNGSTAVEVALKMAIQFWRNEGLGIRDLGLGPNPQSLIPSPIPRSKVLAFNHAYHGDTFGAMSVSDRGVFTLAFENFLFDVTFIDTPTAENISNLKLQVSGTGIAAFIYEPLVQGAGGMNMYDASLMNDLLNTAKLNGIVCIADEVMTGFGRTGKLFASDYMEEKPDIICLSKGLSGGALPLAMTACSEKIFNAFLSDDLYKTFFHGHSYTANPIACAAALASLDLLQEKECLKQIDDISQQNCLFVKRLQTFDPVLQVMNPRSLGTILAFEFHSTDNEYLSKVKEETMETALQHGVLIRPLGNTVYIMPPYCISAEQLKKVYDVIEMVMEKH